MSTTADHPETGEPRQCRLQNLTVDEALRQVVVVQPEINGILNLVHSIEIEALLCLVRSVRVSAEAEQAQGPRVDPSIVEWKRLLLCSRLPHHVVLYLLEFVPFRVSCWDHGDCRDQQPQLQLGKALVGYFSSDATRQPYLIFRSLSAWYHMPGAHTAVDINLYIPFVVRNVRHLELDCVTDLIALRSWFTVPAVSSGRVRMQLQSITIQSASYDRESVDIVPNSQLPPMLRPAPFSDFGENDHDDNGDCVMNALLEMCHGMQVNTDIDPVIAQRLANLRVLEIAQSWHPITSSPADNMQHLQWDKVRELKVDVDADALLLESALQHCSQQLRELKLVCKASGPVWASTVRLLQLHQQHMPLRSLVYWQQPYYWRKDCPIHFMPGTVPESSTLRQTLTVLELEGYFGDLTGLVELPNLSHLSLNTVTHPVTLCRDVLCHLENLHKLCLTIALEYCHHNTLFETLYAMVQDLHTNKSLRAIEIYLIYNGYDHLVVKVDDDVLTRFFTYLADNCSLRAAGNSNNNNSDTLPPLDQYFSMRATVHTSSAGFDMYHNTRAFLTTLLHPSLRRYSDCFVVSRERAASETGLSALNEELEKIASSSGRMTCLATSHCSSDSL